jgi:methylthioribose-1-phosphate isomerase
MPAVNRGYGISTGTKEIRRPENMNNASVEEFFDKVLTVRLTPDRQALDIIDQTLLPGTVKRINLSTKEEIWEAIKKLRVRGAPAIGVSAAYGMAVLSSRSQAADFDSFYSEFRANKEYLASSRPTAVNLFWALNRMEKTLLDNRARSIPEIQEILYHEADRIQAEDVQISRNIGEIGFGLLKDLKKEGRPVGIETHCNAGTLATAKYGTATAPMYIALEHGWKGTDMHVYCDETRPLLQGARLTSFEVASAGITTTVQCDNMASSLMRAGLIDIIFVGCDRVARNGDFANKIGTSGLAIIAKHYGIPFYVCAPSSTIDMETPSGDQIPIEMRDPDEVTEMWYQERMAPKNVNVYNPAFDVTDHSLITGMITEKGLCTAPFEDAFRKIGL